MLERPGEDISVICPLSPFSNRSISITLLFCNYLSYGAVTPDLDLAFSYHLLVVILVEYAMYFFIVDLHGSYCVCTELKLVMIVFGKLFGLRFL